MGCFCPNYPSAKAGGEARGQSHPAIVEVMRAGEARSWWWAVGGGGGVRLGEGDHGACRLLDGAWPAACFKNRSLLPDLSETAFWSWLLLC